MTTSRVPSKYDTLEVTAESVLGQGQPSETWQIRTHADGPAGTVPFTAEFLIDEPSGNHFGMSQNAGMGWDGTRLN